jgi:long-chain fatty acid transport protein
LRGIYATCNYYGYVENIKVGNMPLYQVLDPSKENSANIELSCDQSGIGFTPMLAVDYKTGRWNFSAKYEFKTRMRLKNKSVNKLPSIGNLDDNLKNQMNKLFTGTFMAAGMPQEQAMIKAEQTSNKVLEDPTVVATTAGLKQQFDSKINEALGEYADGKKIAGDIPSLLTVGVGYSPIDELRINVGFHWFDDYNATSYNNRNKLLKKRGTLEFNAGVEYDVTKKITVSTGWQNTNYGLTDKYMDDKSFVVGSNSVGLGGVYHITKKLDFSVAYFHTFYNHVKTSEEVTLAPGKTVTYNSDYTRNNSAFAAGVNITF